jgi:peptidoglycan/xylan/chitin deacetylase (PgdA/CDA1 family)
MKTLMAMPVKFFGLIVIFLCCNLATAKDNQIDNQVKVPILLYHNFAPVAKNTMTIQPDVFAAQMQWLKDNHYTVIPLKNLVDYLRGTGAAPQPKSVVVVVDDGYQSVYTLMQPIVKKYNIPVTLFIYTAVIAKNKSSLTWDELQALQKTGLFTIQSHTVSHPNFKQEKKHLSPEAYQKFIDDQFIDSKKMLEEKLGIKVDMLAYPFGIYDQDLEQHAQQDGYIAAFTIVRHHASKARPLEAQPRYIILNTDDTKNFAAIVQGREDKL